MATSYTKNNHQRRRRVGIIGGYFLALGALIALSAPGCEPLETITENQCGNRVIEPANGEACDEISDRCGAPSTIGACRFVCEYPDTLGEQCPEGNGCGLDGICRRSNGLSDLAISIAGGDTWRLLSGDFDGDDRTDMVAVGLNTADVHFMTTDGFIEGTISLPNERGMPAIGDVDGDGISDIVLALDRSLGILLGQEDRRFVTQGRPMMYLPPATKKVVPLGDFADDGYILQFSEVATPVTGQPLTKIDFLTFTKEGGREHPGEAIPPIPGSQVGAIAAAGIVDGGIRCANVAFEVTAAMLPNMNLAPRVVLGTKCQGGVTGQMIDLPPGTKPWGGAYLGDADSTGERYLFFGAEGMAGPELHVSRINTLGAAMGSIKFLDVNAGECLTSLASAPLAIADFNGDGYPDIADSRGVIVSNPGSSGATPSRHCLQYQWVDPNDAMKEAIGWTQVVVGDFNGDGRKDLLGARKNDAVLDLWIWQTGGFNTVPISVGAPVSDLVSGDFDGDGIADAAFRLMEPLSPEAPPDTQPDAEAHTPLFALFGNPMGLPSSPRVIGFFRPSEHLIAGRMWGWNSAGRVDVMSDIAIISPKDKEMRNSVTIVQGNPTRNLVSPLTLTKNATLDVLSTDNIYGVVVSQFGVEQCEYPTEREGQELTPSNVIAMGDGTLWLAGCYANGSSHSVDEMLIQDNGPLLFTPVDPVESVDPNSPNESTMGATTKLGMFMNTPTKSASSTPMIDGIGLGQVEFLDKDNFVSLDVDLPILSDNVQLPILNAPDVPYLFADLDHDGRRDVILTAQSDTQRKVLIYWSVDGDLPFDIETPTHFDLPVGGMM
ncbi:MAG TPA: VCBS repeat-containing protein, partial [Polyangium sp.]|nr:VCBS repeat-containing protein [Polyangium sp.]